MTKAFGWRGAAFAAALLAVPAAASAQGQLVVYSANEQTLDELVFDAFKKETGIEVQPVSGGSGVVFRRVVAEKDRPLGDIVWGVSRSLLQQHKSYFQAFRSAHRDAIPAEFRDPDDLWIGNNLHLLVVLQNTKAMPADQGPKAWADLLDPKLKGKIAFTDPANSGSAYTNATLMVDLLGGGDPGWGKLGEFFRNTRVLNRSSLVFQGVGQGEYALGVSMEYAGYLWANNGAPVKVIYPAEGTYAAMEGVAIIKGGPNTENAKKFVDYINRKDVREMILAKHFRRPARQDIDLSKMPGGMPQLSSIKLAPYDETRWTEQRVPTLARIKDVIVQTR
ncbi:iron(III) transport system substrate-binding protein [Stella humosa]|uniref:Iron(III) transport system substrate-binding protein n=1 Tax=Stella humosa TaxID=94 RepID=A0A3N1KIC8_9PROT|nr:extracellular solute-binding protein [Stella humosa]ROP81313.1 iron(III) transport system substrate-binding protein [Stella humosa]BBK32662.1 iron ABC transporter substrate-binding protein [Stella humosa]